jgi:peptidoglycan/xylan/chitin deacetylase (PgdA/CDA1 family)
MKDMMTRFRILLLAASLVSAVTAAPADPAKIVVIKADDYRGLTPKWKQFIEASRELGASASIGVIVDGIAGKAEEADAMRKLEAAGDIGFWNHGWDHRRWTDGKGKALSEFGGSGLDHQRKHLADAQAGLLAALGREEGVFGTPYNAFDKDTATAINATPAIRLFFANSPLAARLLDKRVSLLEIIAEQDGTGKPNAAKFKASFPKGPAGPVSLQFHPAAFPADGIKEYKGIIRHLKSNGYTFLLPSEYIAISQGGKPAR